jgi:precorrin-2 dehydrogenase/sirohydrochlorin ferrochelatase
MTATYPIELQMTGRPVVVVGGGPVAARKVEALLQAGAHVRVVSLQFVEQLLQRQDIVREQRPYGPDCLQGVQLAFACTHDRAVNAAIAEDARRLGVWCNVVDKPEDGDFHLPAVLRQGELTFCVSTGGAGPALAKAVRDRLASHFGPEWSILTEELARARHILKDRVGDPELRREILETLCTDCSLTLLTTRDREAWRTWFERVTEYRVKGFRPTPDGL